MTQLLLVRHEEAHPAPPGSDSLRTLTPIGRRRMYKQANALVHLLTRLDHIWTSPLVRAVQTAEILQSAFAMETPVSAAEIVVQPPNFDALKNHIASGSNPTSVSAVVGHEPTMSMFLSHLTEEPSSHLGFSTGQAVLLSAHGSRYKVERALRGGESVAI